MFRLPALTSRVLSRFSASAATKTVPGLKPTCDLTARSFAEMSSNRKYREPPVDKPLTREEMTKNAKEYFSKLPIAKKRDQYACGATGYTPLDDIMTWEFYAKVNDIEPAESPKYAKRQDLNGKISMFTGDITHLEIDAIVNAANKALLGGGGVDGAIHRAAGSELKRESGALAPCETGHVKITSGYRLPARYVIHTVGPIGHGGANDKRLADCYRNSLNLAVENGLKTIAIPCISTGVYGFPNEKAAHIALETTREWLEDTRNAKEMTMIIFVLFMQKDIEIYQELLPIYFPVGISMTDNFVLVDYPGVVKDPTKALETLGGLPRISKVVQRNNKHLRLNMHPESVYHRPITSQKHPGNDPSAGTIKLVVRVTRKKGGGPDAEVKSRILGLVDSVHTFRTLCDYQFLPVQKTDDGTYENLAPKLIPQDITSALQWFDEIEAETSEAQTPLFTPPFTYSRYTQASPYPLTREIEHEDEDIRRVKEISIGQSTRVERRALSVSVNYDDVFPEAPNPQAVADAEHRCPDAAAHKLMQHLFTLRPLWTKPALLDQTKIDDVLMKYIIGKYAFYIQSGPWGRMWCRFGYDPRKNPDSKQYQCVQINFRRSKAIPQRNRLKIGASNEDEDDDFLALSNNASTSLLSTWSYHPGDMPVARMVSYSLIDVHLPIAQEYVRSHINSGQIVDPVYGFLLPDALEMIRNEVKNNVQTTADRLISEQSRLSNLARSSTLDEGDEQMQ